MVKYAISFPGTTPKKFEEYDVEKLKDANENKGCDIYVQCDNEELGKYPALVLHSLIPLDESVVHSSRVIGEYSIYMFPYLVDEKEYKTFKKFMLAMHPTAKDMNYYPAPGYFYSSENNRLEEQKVLTVDKSQFQDIVLYQNRYDQTLKDIFQGSMITAAEADQFKEIQTLFSVKSIMEHFPKEGSEPYYVPYIDRVMCNEMNSAPIGNAMTYAFLACKRSINETKRFFRDKYHIAFNVEEEDFHEPHFGSKLITEAEGLSSKGYMYYSGDDKVTDFIIRVRYVLTGYDGGKKYIVDLVGDTVAEGIEYPNIFNKAGFKQKISYYGPFHFVGSDADINKLHKAVSNTVAPEIEPLLGFGFHKGKLIACENCVYDMENKVRYDRDGFYYFNKDLRKGFCILDAQNCNLLMTMQGMPNFYSNQEKHSSDDYLDYFSQFYRDQTGGFLFIYVLGLIFAGKYRYLTDFKFPYLILTGKYGSGKSATSDMIKRVYNITNIEKAQTKYGETTPFSFINQCSYRPGFPMFITEFKEQDEEHGDAKVSNLISMYDRTTVSKGTATQKLIYYYLNALAVIDGEELPKRSALKSRSIIVNIRTANHALSGSEYKEKMNDPIQTHLLSDALSKPCLEGDYKEAVHTGMRIFAKKFPGAAPRLLEGLGAIYAGAVVFDKSLADAAVHYLTPLVEEQLRLEQETFGAGELLGIVKKYAKQLDYNNVYWYSQEDKKFYLRVDDFGAFLARYHIRLSLGYESVRTYFPLVDYVEDDNGGLVECAIWPMGPDFPRQLLFHPHAYRAFKDLTPIS